MKTITKILFIVGILFFGVGKLLIDTNNVLNPMLALIGVLSMFTAILMLIWNRIDRP